MRMRGMLGLMAVAGMVAQATVAAAQQQAPVRSPTLENIRARGEIVCGMQGDNPPFSFPDAQGVWRGMDADSCRALAAAIFGDPAKARIRPVTGLTRFPAVQSGEVDVLFGSTTWITTRETRLGLVFASVNYFSGQGFLVHAALGVKSLKEIDGATICVPPGSTTEVILQDWFRNNGGSFTPVVIDDPNQIQAAFLSGRCDVYTRDVTGLSGFRFRQPEREKFVVLPEVITMEPLGAFIRKGDDAWLDIVRWTQFALITAEQLGVNAANVEAQMAATNPDIRKLLGAEGDIGPSMGLDAAWAANAVKAVGNYGEMWTRNVEPMGLPRGLNRLWDKGGLQFTPPLR